MDRGEKGREDYALGLKLQDLLNQSKKKVGELQMLLAKERAMVGRVGADELAPIVSRQARVSREAIKALLTLQARLPLASPESARGKTLTVSMRKAESRRGSQPVTAPQSTSLDLGLTPSAAPKDSGSGGGSLPRRSAREARRPSVPQSYPAAVRLRCDDPPVCPPSEQTNHSHPECPSTSRQRPTLEARFRMMDSMGLPTPHSAAPLTPFWTRGERESSSEGPFQSPETSRWVGAGALSHSRSLSEGLSCLGLGPIGPPSSQLGGLARSRTPPPPPTHHHPPLPLLSLTAPSKRHAFMEETKPFEMEDCYKYSTKFRDGKQGARKEVGPEWVPKDSEAEFWDCRPTTPQSAEESSSSSVPSAEATGPPELPPKGQPTRRREALPQGEAWLPAKPTLV